MVVFKSCKFSPLLFLVMKSVSQYISAHLSESTVFLPLVLICSQTSAHHEGGTISKRFYNLLIWCGEINSVNVWFKLYILFFTNMIWQWRNSVSCLSRLLCLICTLCCLHHWKQLLRNNPDRKENHSIKYTKHLLEILSIKGINYKGCRKK